MPTQWCGLTVTNFVVDGMLGSLARKLRVFGFDAQYCRQEDDDTVIAVARRRRGIVLTSDRLLEARATKRGVAAILIRGDTDAQRLRYLAAKMRQVGRGLTAGPPRCAMCNGRLASAPRESLRGVLPARVVACHRLFFACARCGRVYWRGGHWKKLRRLQGLLRE